MRMLGAKPSADTAAPAVRTAGERRPDPLSDSLARRPNRGPDDLDRLVQIVHGPHDALGRLRILDEAARALQGHPRREQPLDRQVVQIAGDPVPVLQNRDLLGVVAALGKLHGDRGLRGEALQRFDLLAREGAASSRACSSASSSSSLSCGNRTRAAFASEPATRGPPDPLAVRAAVPAWPSRRPG
ncbi:hypothetical protein GCM10018783_02370 [Streptomyces griseosporeus]|nr:hypothetical protein GCM10018783_02370 [Streptomyces griseosporeus]